MRKYRLYRFSYVIIPRTDIPILNNKIILLKNKKTGSNNTYPPKSGKERLDFVIC